MTPSASSASSPSSLSSLPTLATADSGTSTTLDVTLCLLLVSAAVGVLAAAGPPVDDHDPRTADAVADRLTATTVAVDYVLGSGDGTNTPLEGTASVAARERTVQGTPAALLARAAVADLAVADGAVVGSTPAEASPFERAVANRTGRVVADVDASVNVTATYAPVPGSDVHGRATVGPKPPADADVSVVRVRVPVGRGDSGVHAERATARGADRDGFAGVARVLADATVSTVLPTSRARWALRDAATAGVVAARYHASGVHSASTSTRRWTAATSNARTRTSPARSPTGSSARSVSSTTHPRMPRTRPRTAGVRPLAPEARRVREPSP